ncbi:hypothetical protein C1646_782981 [Rhizophagus diaphanus]|nr:hypothetical protein C1646_782981 [Rhizophagus diaphanus] [Rhizophagus sp. MUCL 43196]
MILQPHEDQPYYHLISGEHGTGKTTLIKIASKEKRISFTGQLMQKFKTNDSEPKISKWEIAMRVLNHASTVYREKHNKSMVIVYDNIDCLVHTNPKILDILQDDAKRNADDRKYIAVFVSSEGSVPPKNAVAWSRADTPVIEIGDLSERESMEYLNKCRIDETEAKKLYELVGGRIIDLVTVANKSLKGKSFEDIKKNILMKVEDKMSAAKLLKNYQHYEVGKIVIDALLKSKELRRTTYEEFFDKPEVANEILEANVFSYHPEKNVVTFQSRAVEVYVQEYSINEGSLLE